MRMVTNNANHKSVRLFALFAVIRIMSDYSEQSEFLLPGGLNPFCGAVLRGQPALAAVHRAAAEAAFAHLREHSALLHPLSEAEHKARGGFSFFSANFKHGIL